MTQISRRSALVGFGAAATAFASACRSGVAMELPLTGDAGRRNFVFFQDFRRCRFSELSACLQNNKLLTGVSFNLSAERIDRFDFGELEWVLSKVPASFALQVNMDASGLSLNRTYPFATRRLPVSFDGRRAIEMNVPVITDPRLTDWMVEKWARVVAWLTARGLSSRLNGANACLTSSAPYDPEQTVPGAKGMTRAAQIAYWRALGVTDTAIAAVFRNYIAALAAGPLNGRYITVEIWHPSKTGVGAEGDGARFYTSLVEGMIKSANQNGATYVVIDQSISADAPRPEIQACADKARAFAGQLVVLGDLKRAELMPAYENAWRRPDTRWVELHPAEVSLITAGLGL